MQRLRRVAAAAVVAALAATGVTACGDDDGEGASGAKVLKLWHYESANSAMGVAWDKAIEIFKQEHPGVEVRFERKAFEQIQQNAGMIINSSEGPDVMEYNKGNATAGLLSSQGLLTDLTAQATKRGWDKALSPSLQTTARYSDKGVMGSGNWYGVPNYGEYVMVYYNKDLFTRYGVQVPTTLDEMTKAMDTFVGKGVTPLGTAGAEYPAGQLFYELALARADRAFVDNYQLYKNPVDFHADPLKYGADTFAEWVRKGYVSKNAASAKAEDMGTAFIAGKTPMIVSGSWWYGRFKSEIKFDWDTFLFPGNKLNAGSSGNIWVVPTSSKAKDLAYDFIDITMRPEVQALIGNNGGVPVVGDPAKISDAKDRKLIENFNAISAQDGLAFYPDWPVPGYYDVLVAGFQGLINQSKSPDQVLDAIAKPYQDGVAEIKRN
ncbi:MULTISPECIES: extracellular solute-binding protein [Micromonospora]|uniref:Extracellular solute-binding protein n=1 Tax=Micromonospora solifontis TaxID=2487138 RepID=A0ABX9WAN5_9ACTN|nr:MULTISPECIES: extracellular solute-binding protein [Micromonospora]NES14983.1 extracellular solute-binding protein [Micromonospora sp. PPF5-17B]NES39133.1 extracellular solute-binding protein [Micromonospora solifontis]NES58578.1 extracellular solute-binding protein [Micromonospora sp. PPF5-6]RNL90813.1 extracellular solute-binding protein [Micromonospora solifontis]